MKTKHIVALMLLLPPKLFHFAKSGSEVMATMDGVQSRRIRAQPGDYGLNQGRFRNDYTLSVK